MAMTAESIRSAPPNYTDHTATFPPSTPGGRPYTLSFRIWPAALPASSAPAPFITWTHGGGFIAGRHYTPLPWLFPAFNLPTSPTSTQPYHLISHSYRLSPQVDHAQMVSDCVTAIVWLRANLPRILGADKVDVDRYVITGESAGGNLVTQMGLHLPDPKPRVVVDMYGPVDLLKMGLFEDVRPANQWLDEGDGKVMGKWDGEFTAEELDSFMGDRDEENVMTVSLTWREDEFLSEEELGRRWGAEVRYTRRVRLQKEFQVYRHLWLGPRGLVRPVFHPERYATEGEVREAVRRGGALSVLRDELERVKKEGKGEGLKYPPTAILHGMGDGAVPVEQSYELERVLKEGGVPVVGCYEEGQGHVFDARYTSPDVPGWDKYIQPIVDFVAEHINDPLE